jgi:tetratricopeptide (TPR) repeat protein
MMNEALEILGGGDWISAHVFPHRARAYLGAGQIAEARQDAETGIAMARQFENRAGEGEARLSLALVLAASEPPDYAAAEGEFAEAEQCLRECEYRTELALALRCHGEMRLKMGDGAGAEPLLREARELYASMGRIDDTEALDALLGLAPSRLSPAT